MTAQLPHDRAAEINALAKAGDVEGYWRELYCDALDAANQLRRRINELETLIVQLDQKAEAAIRSPLDISKADRATILDGLAKLSYGYARDLAAKIKATECPVCSGSGFAAYVGGDDDDDACTACDGEGFR